MKKLYQCMPVGERAWLARVAIVGAVLWMGMIIAVAFAPASDDMRWSSIEGYTDPRAPSQTTLDAQEVDAQEDPRTDVSTVARALRDTRAAVSHR